jgi:hypothetical protein
MARFREFDAAELSLSSYVISLGQDAPFIAIPVFPSRAFRHNSIYVNAASGINEPADLAGRLVGVPEYQVTAAVWIRGILAEHYGVAVDSVRYRTGGLHRPGRTDKIKHAPPAGVEIQPIPPGATLDGMLAEGTIDALYSPRTPTWSARITSWATTSGRTGSAPTTSPCGRFSATPTTRAWPAGFSIPPISSPQRPGKPTWSDAVRYGLGKILLI